MPGYLSLRMRKSAWLSYDGLTSYLGNGFLGTEFNNQQTVTTRPSWLMSKSKNRARALGGF
jgi:hypothetical protein